LNDYAEKDHETAAYLNAYFPHLLEKIMQDSNAMVVHISTDCVFSGMRGGYTEQDFPDGRTFYDRSKALGEIVNDKDITLRCSIVGPDLNSQGIGLMNWFLQQKGEVKGYAHAIWTGQTTLQLAKSIEQAVLARATGLYHMVPAQGISKYDLLGLFNRYIRKNEIAIARDETFKADKSLKRTNFEGFDYIVPDYETQIVELGNWMRKHKKLYPHYEL
jgi:dTDP-4-dehydrorhamnose reductase